MEFRMSRHIAGLTFSALALLSAVRTAHAEGDATITRKAIDAVIHPILKEYDIPGMAVAIIAHDRRYIINYGVASKTTGQGVTEETLFEIGSVTKTLTATAVAYARSVKKLDVTAPVSNYLPLLRKTSFDRITALDLGTYSAGGLPLQFPPEVSSSDQMIHYFRSWKPECEPGACRLYSNPSAGLFGHIASASMKMPFKELMEKHVFAGLGLKNTYFDVPADKESDYAQGYTSADSPVRVAPGPFDAQAYAIKSTSADMLRFVAAHLDASQLEASMQAALSATLEGHYRVGPMTQALGWERYEVPVNLDELTKGNSPNTALQRHNVVRLEVSLPPQEAAYFNKTGSTSGFGAYLAFLPSEKFGVVLLANKNYPNAVRVKAAFDIMVLLRRPKDGSDGSDRSQASGIGQ